MSYYVFMCNLACHEIGNFFKKVSHTILFRRTVTGSTDFVLRITRIVPNEIFSPASGGRVNVSRAMLEMSAQGMIRLKT